MRAWFGHLARLTCRRYLSIIAASTVLTVISGYYVVQLVRRLETDVAALIPKDYPSVQALEEIKSRVGGVGSLIVLANCPEYEASKRFADQLARILESGRYRQYVKYVDYRRDVGFYRDHALLYMKLEDLEEIHFRVEDRIRLEKLRLSPLFIQLDGSEGGAELDFSDIEAKYRPGLRFGVEDLREPGLLARRMQSADDPLSRYLRDGLPPQTRRHLEGYDPSVPPRKSLQSDLVDRLNRAVRDTGLYDPERFAGTTLSARTRGMARQDLKSDARIRLNKRLLEEALTPVLARSQESRASEDEDGYYTNADRSILALEVMAAGTVSNIGFTKALYEAVRGAVEGLDPRSFHPELVVEYGGTYKNKIDEYEVILSDIKSTLVYGVVGVILLLTLYFRQPMAALFVAIPLAMGLTWAFAITYWVIGNLNTMTGFLFVILFGLGIDFGIHMFARYLEDRMGRLDVMRSIETMLRQTGRAILAAALTTSMAFYSLTITDFRGFSEFGFIVGTGIVMSLVAMTTVLPAFLVLADQKLGWIRMRPVWGHAWGTERGRFPVPGLVLGLGLAATVYLGVNLHRIQFEYDFTNLRSNLPSSRAVKQKISTIEGFSTVSQSPSVVLADSRAELEEVVEAVERKIAAEDPTPTIHTVKTLWSALPEQQNAKLEIIGQIRDLTDGEGARLLKGDQKESLDDLRQLLDVTALSLEDLPQGMLRRFSTVDGSHAHFAFIYPDVELRDGKNAMAFAHDSQIIRTVSGKVFYSSSASIIFADMLRLMLRDSKWAVGATLAVVLLIVFADFRRLRHALLVVLPLVCGAVWMCGAMYLTGMKLNFYNIVALPTIIGMGIDNGLHLHHRYLEEGPNSMPLVLRSTGGAMLVSMLTTMVGFLGLILAAHPGLNSIGELATIGLVTCFVAAVLVLPALLQLLEPRPKPQPPSQA